MFQFHDNDKKKKISSYTDNITNILIYLVYTYFLHYMINDSHSRFKNTKKSFKGKKNIF